MNKSKPDKKKESEKKKEITIDQIEHKKEEIKTDGYSMSIGELSNLYKEGDIELHPEFQRVFRWDTERKTTLVESIMLGIPIPSIFVSQRKNGKWDVVDGLQRLSTIFEFMGILKDDEGKLKDKLKLTKPEFITTLENRTWDNICGEESQDDTNSIQILFKRAKIDIKIIQQDETNTVKYELFKRLNSGGLNLSEQEVRNCLILLENKDFFEWLKKLSENTDYIECISLPDNLENMSYDLELLVRFIVLTQSNETDLKGIKSLNKFLDKKIIEIASNDKLKIFDREKLEDNFKKTFSILNRSMKDNTFKKYYSEQDKFRGKFLISAFEAIAVGLSYNIEQYFDDENNIKECKIKLIYANVKNLWNNENFKSRVGSGVLTQNRINTTISIGKKTFNTRN